MKKLKNIVFNRNLQIMQEAEDGIMGIYTDPITRRQYTFIFSWGGGWEHLSVSTPSKTPDWDTMCLFKDMFWEENEVCIQYHPKKQDYVNVHEHCLHIWRPINVMLPIPPKLFV